MAEKMYRREDAVAYAHRWAYARNPRYYNYDKLGGDCTNFVSQCVYAGAGVMNYTPVYGWFYLTADHKAPAWTGVDFFHRFMMRNSKAGPYGVSTDRTQVRPGDVSQLAFGGDAFTHSQLIVEVGREILVATHSMDSDYRPLSSWDYTNVRYIHVLGVRTP